MTVSRCPANITWSIQATAPCVLGGVGVQIAAGRSATQGRLTVQIVPIRLVRECPFNPQFLSRRTRPSMSERSWLKLCDSISSGRGLAMSASKSACPGGLSPRASTSQVSCSPPVRLSTRQQSRRLTNLSTKFQSPRAQSRSHPKITKQLRKGTFPHPWN